MTGYTLADSTPSLVDEVSGVDAQDYTYTATYRIAEHMVRVSVRRNFYASQSHAVAEVLTPELTWTQLATNPSSNWCGKDAPIVAPSAAKEYSERFLVPVAANLAVRSAHILGARC